MADDKIDYGGVPITKLPPGKAYGADDLQRWSHNRAVGWSGSGEKKAKAVVLECRKCGAVTDVIVRKHAKENQLHLRCRSCNAGNLKFIKFKKV